MTMRIADSVRAKLRGGWADRLGPSRAVAWSAWALMMMILAATVAVGMLHLRLHLRDHLAQRDGNVLSAVALARQYANGSGSNLTQRLARPADQLALALEISQIKEGVLGVRLFDATGRFETAFPPTLIATNLPRADLEMLRGLRPVSRFHDKGRLDNYFLVDGEPGASPASAPLLEVTIPLYPRDSSNLAAAAQLLLDGRSVASEYNRVDAHLWLLGAGLYAGGALLLSTVLAWAYGRLRKAHALVKERTAGLLRANHELALAAKTSALGSVTAHLIHGLSNPLANLQDFIASRNGSPTQDFQAVAEATRRMQQLVHDVVRVLGEERGGDHYLVTLAELVEVLNQKLRNSIDENEAHLVTILDAEGSVSNRDANLILLVLENLVHNALKVTPPGGHVRLRISSQNGTIRCEVRDQGKGIDPQVLPRLFTPCHSTHGGSGLGLAISKQLASHIGATLELQANSEAGCVFALMLPRSVFAEAESPKRD